MEETLKKVFDLIEGSNLTNRKEVALGFKENPASLTADELKLLKKVYDKDKDHPAVGGSLLGAFDTIMEQRKLKEKTLAGLESLKARDADAREQKTEMPSTEEVADIIAEAAGPQNTQLSLNFFSPYPTAMTRISPYFVMSKNERANRPYMKNLPLMVDNSWGGMSYWGPKLSVDTDEDVIVALLSLVNENKEMFSWEEGEDVPSEPTCAYVGSKRKLAARAFGVEKPDGDHYKRLDEALIHMASAVVEIWQWRNTTRGGKKKERILITNMISHVIRVSDRKIAIKLNPYFYQILGLGQVTLIDPQVRLKFKSWGKCLYRFCESHQDNHWVGPMEILLSTTNIPVGKKTPVRVASDMRAAIKSLVKEGILLPNSYVKSIEGSDDKYKVFLALDPDRRPKMIAKKAAKRDRTMFRREIQDGPAK